MTSGVGDPYQYLADYERNTERMQAQVSEAQNAFTATRAQASSPDGAVTVTVAAGGRIEGLQLTPKAMDLGHTRLGSTIIETIRRAQIDAAQQIEQAMRPVLGDGAGMDFLREQVQQSIASVDPTGELAEEARQREAERSREETERADRASEQRDDDDDFGGGFLMGGPDGRR